MIHDIISDPISQEKNVSDQTAITPNEVTITSDDVTEYETSNKTRSHGWFAAPNAIIDNLSLSVDATLLLLCLLRHKPGLDSGKFTLRDTYLCKRLNCKKRKLGRLFTELRTAGYVRNVPLLGEKGRYVGSRRLFSAFPEFLKTENSEPTYPDKTEVHQTKQLDETEMYTKRHVGETAVEHKKTKPQHPFKKTNVEPSLKKQIEDIFLYWQATLKHPQSKLDKKRRTAITKALELYPIEQLKKAILGCSKTPHNMGHNDTGEIYDDIELIFRNAGNIERFARNADQPPVVKPKYQSFAAEKARVNVRGFKRGAAAYRRLAGYVSSTEEIGDE